MGDFCFAEPLLSSFGPCPQAVMALRVSINYRKESEVSCVYPVEPHDGWTKGDLAYCVNPTRESRPYLERGRVYRVVAAKKPSNIAHHGLKLAGITTGEAWGFWSNRFIKLGPLGGRLREIATDTEYTMAHYWPGCGVDPAWRIEKKRAKRNARLLRDRDGSGEAGQTA